MAHLDFEEDVEAEILDGFKDEEEFVGEVGIEMYKENTERVLRLMKRTDNEKLQPLLDEVTDTYRDGDEYKFHVAHPAAPFHEYGALTASLTTMNTSDYAFSWSDENIRKVNQTVPGKYWRDDGPLRIPALRFMHKARMLTIGQMWREFKSNWR